MGSDSVTGKTPYKLQKQGNLLWSRAAFGCNDSALIVTVRLLVDTGASYTMLSNRFIQSIAGKAIEPLRSESILTANGSITAPVIPVPWIHCLGNRIEQFPIVACALPTNAFIDGLLGMDFLIRCAAVIDVHKAEIYVS